MTKDTLLTELERQEKYLSELPDNFEYPLFNVRHAVESQRRSGYRDTAAASREIIDNAVEAGADRIDVVFDTDSATGKKNVSAIAFIDNGSGMLPQMVRYALTWGGGTHFEDHDFIGRFGFGLPNSSINQTRRVEVYSRTAPNEPVMRGLLDITSPSSFGMQSIDEPVEAELPEFVTAYLKKQKLKFDHGTVVVWVRPDRLSYKRPSALKEHMLDDFGVTYRYQLHNDVMNPDGLRVYVEGVDVAPVDPLFLLPGARFYMTPDEGGVESDRENLAVRYWEDPETGEHHLSLIRDTEEIDRAIAQGDTVGAIQVTVARLPIGFAADKSDNPDAVKRFEIRKAHRGMSFVRAGREIQTVDVFPRSQKDKSSGLGDWPLLQSYAYHWGIEVRFDPTLDDVFGITNDKQGVRPIEDFWRVLVAAEIDAAARRENNWQSTQRRKPRPAKPATDGPSSGEAAAQAADVGANDRTEPPAHKKEAAKQAHEEAVEAEVQKRADGDTEAARKAVEEREQQRKYVIDYHDVLGGAFFEPDWNGKQIVVKVNRLHQFYQVLYGDLMRLDGGSRAKEAVDVLLITLARAELTQRDEERAAFLGAQRRSNWSPFLENALSILAAKVPMDEEATTDGHSAEVA